MKRSFLREKQYEQKTDWRRIVGWVDREVFKDVDVLDNKQFEDARRRAEHILLPLQKWYKDIYRKTDKLHFVDIPFEVTIASHQITDSPDLISLEDRPVITLVEDIVSNEIQLYNSIRVRGLGWLVCKLLKIEKVTINHLAIGPKGFLDSTVITCDKKTNERVESVILSIADSMSRGIYYPSKTAMCDSCIFRKGCYL